MITKIHQWKYPKKLQFYEGRPNDLLGKKRTIEDSSRLKTVLSGVPWWLSGLRIWHCPCCGSGYSCDIGSIPSLGMWMLQKNVFFITEFCLLV